MTVNKPSRFVRIHGKRPANKAARIRRMQERIIKRLDKELASAQ